MTNARVKEFLQTRTGMVLSALLHTAVIGWGLISLATRPLEALPQDIVPVDVISDEKLSQMMKGVKNGDKNETKPQVDKIGDAKSADDAVGKIDDKKAPIQPTADKPPPKPEPKPVEKKPDPPKPVAQDKPKDEPKPADKTEEPKVDQIAEQLKKDPQKDPPKPDAKATPQPKKEYAFNAADTKALLDKRDPTRQSVTGQQLNSKSQIGTAAGAAQKLTMGWVGALQKRISDCWAVPAGVRDADTMEVRIQIRLGPNGMLQAPPELVEAPRTDPAVGIAFAQSAIRAIQQCQPYSFLPQAEYKGGWDFMDMTFSPKDLFHR